MMTDANLPESTGGTPTKPAGDARGATEGWAVASLACGVLGLVCLLPVIGQVLAIVFGHVAMHRIRRSPAEAGGRGLAVGGLIAGYLGLLAIPAMVVLGLLAYKAIEGSGLGDRSRIADIIAKENKYFDYKVQFLAAHLAEAHPGARYLVITNQQTEYTAERHRLMLASFAKAGLDIVRVHEVMPSEEVEELMEVDLFLTAEKFDRILAANAEADIAISTLGLPMDYRDMQIWNVPAWTGAHDGKAPPKLVLLDAYIYDLKKEIEAGLIAAVVQYRPDAMYKPNEEVPTTPAEAFHKRYILITPDNVNETAARYEGLFMAEPEGK